MKLEHYFPVTIGKRVLDAPDVQKINLSFNEWYKLNEQKFEDNPQEIVLNTFNTIDNVLDLKEFEILKEKILEYSNLFLINQRTFLKDGYELAIEASWINVFRPNFLESAHHHYGSLLSGVYYIEGSEKSGSFKFEDPNALKVLWYYSFSKMVNFDQLKKDTCIDPHEGLLILFPSWLTHNVTKNLTNSRRISVAFNISPNLIVKT